MNKKKQEWQLREVVNDGNERLSFKYVGFYNLLDMQMFLFHILSKNSLKHNR